MSGAQQPAKSASKFTGLSVWFVASTSVQRTASSQRALSMSTTFGRLLRSVGVT